MIAEWCSGTHPFPDAWSLRDATSVALGRHAELDVPARLRPVLERALGVDPAERPELSNLIAALEES
jgi:hypothetical protein